jgi:RTX toxin transport system membrane fusion protein
VKILNKDVGFVRTGQVASVQLDAFNYIKYGAIDGVVENIYQDSIEDTLVIEQYSVKHGY